MGSKGKPKFCVGQVVWLDDKLQVIHRVTVASKRVGGWHYWIGGIGYAASLLKPFTKTRLSREAGPKHVKPFARGKRKP